MPIRGSRAARLIAGAGAAASLLASGLITSGAASAASAPVHYVALGDSYSSGLGAGSLIASSGSCDRSAKAFTQLWATAHRPASFVSVACSGATTATVISTQLPALSTATTLVSITAGGNDVGFGSTLETCILRGQSSCVSAIKADESRIASALPGRLDTMLADISARAPGAQVVVLGYPALYDLSRSAVCPGLTTTDRTDLNQAAGLLDNAIKAAAGRHADVFEDVRPEFAGHLICDSNRWLNAVSILDIPASYHPNAAGQAYGYLPAFSAGA
jgi:lysophospholipase L1-like esterase